MQTSSAQKIEITFPDGSVRPFESGMTGRDIAESISPRLAKEALAVMVNGETLDLSAAICENASVEILTFEDAAGRKIFWHSTSHIMAQAVTDIFPDVKLAIGPPIDEGFYYDFEVGQPFSPEALERIERRMSAIVSEKAPFSR